MEKNYLRNFVSLIKSVFSLTNIPIVLFVIFFQILLFESHAVAQNFANLGTGTAVNGTTEASPVNNHFRRRIMQFVYTAAELNAAGLVGGATIDQIGWYVTSNATWTKPGYTIKMKHVSASDVSSALGTTGWTTVVNSFTYPTNWPTNTWQMMTFNNNFVWDGTSNIGVEVCWSRTGDWNATGQCRIYSTTNGFRHSATDASGSSCGETPGNITTSKPQARLRFTIPPYLAQVVNIDYGPSNWCIGETRNVTVSIKNNGTATWLASGPTAPCAASTNPVAVAFRWNGNNFDTYNLPPNFSNRNPLPSNVAPGATVDVTFPVRTPIGDPLGSNNLSINLIAQECLWFKDNASPVYTSPNINIGPTIPAAPNLAEDGPICIGETLNLTGSGLAPGGQVASFNGTSSSMSSHSYGGSVTNNFTIEFWVKPTATHTITPEANTGTFGVNAGHRYVTSPNAQGGGVASSVGVSVGTNGVSLVEHDAGHAPVPLVYQGDMTGWNHVSVVYINRVPHLYVNGVLARIGLQSIRANIFPVVGTTGIWSGWFSGQIDNLRIFNISKTPAQIRQDMYLEIPITGGLIANYNFNSSNGNATVGTNTTTSGVTFPAQDYYTYTWSGGPNLPAPSASQTQTTGVYASGGLFDYTVTASTPQCGGTESDPITVTVNQVPTVNSIVAPN